MNDSKEISPELIEAVTKLASESFLEVLEGRSFVASIVNGHINFCPINQKEVCSTFTQKIDGILHQQLHFGGNASVINALKSLMPDWGNEIKAAIAAYEKEQGNG